MRELWHAAHSWSRCPGTFENNGSASDRSVSGLDDTASDETVGPRLLRVHADVLDDRVTRSPRRCADGKRKLQLSERPVAPCDGEELVGPFAMHIGGSAWVVVALLPAMNRSRRARIPSGSRGISPPSTSDCCGVTRVRSDCKWPVCGRRSDPSIRPVWSPHAAPRDRPLPRRRHHPVIYRCAETRPHDDFRSFPGEPRPGRRSSSPGSTWERHRRAGHVFTPCRHRCQKAHPVASSLGSCGRGRTVRTMPMSVRNSAM